MKKIITVLALLPLLVSCDDLFTPADENIRSIDAMYNEPSYAQGILANAYILLPYSASSNTDVATDDAVSNNSDNTYLKMASGGTWASNNDPLTQWATSRHAIQYINLFLERTDSVNWAQDAVIKEGFKERFRGEAYALRALFMYNLLRAHAGWTSDGQLLGVPILTKSEDANSDFNVARNTFKDCMDSLLADANRAAELLPAEYADLNNDADIPARYKAKGITNVTDYNRLYGATMGGRITGRVAQAIRAEATLLAASPAYSKGSGYTYQQAADYAATVIDALGGIGGLAANGYTWYTNTTEIANLASGANPKEIIWRGGTSENNDLETDNFPPTLYGKGRVDPTQNLVDAFPMVNGYPISDSRSGYDDTDPYYGRDPRLAAYVVYDGSTQGPSSTVITTGSYGTTTDDQLNHQSGYSTRTGYYLRKLLRSDCNPNSVYNVKQKHYTSYIRATEIFLDYAEAANEAFGPTGMGSHAYSAYDVVKAIRKRAGVGVSNGDAYLESIKGDQDKMRELIRNERRLELCFENFRFWDLRRWKVSLDKLNETARGMQITENTDGSLKYTPIDVESRKYEDYMYYGPVPYEETQKWSNLQQNAGWTR
jgi:starch-binding outer membrane protein, SusD/RagB family